MHRYYAPLMVDGPPVAVKLTVKKFARKSEVTRVYSIEALNIVKPARNWTASISENRQNYVPQAGFEEQIRSKFENVNRDSVSTVVDKNGEPRTQQRFALEITSPRVLCPSTGATPLPPRSRQSRDPPQRPGICDWTPRDARRPEAAPSP